jgi:hypothetical protein
MNDLAVVNAVYEKFVGGAKFGSLLPGFCDIRPLLCRQLAAERFLDSRPRIHMRLASGSRLKKKS